MVFDMNGILNLNKPTSCTSHDMVSFARRVLKEPQMGHMGTLDPMATGVLPLAIGAATRLVEFASFDKEYVATCLLGKTTDSCDIFGKTLQEKPTENLSESDVREQTHRLRFITHQVPPMVSAVKKNGHKLYELARKGIVVKREARPIRIENLEVLQVEIPRVTFRVACSAGTYIRVFCHSLGETLGVGGCMENLKRTRVGTLMLENALTPEDVIKKEAAGGILEVMLPPSLLVKDLPEMILNGKDLVKFCQGISYSVPCPPGTYRILNRRGMLCAIGEAQNEDHLKPRKVFGEEGIP